MENEKYKPTEQEIKSAEAMLTDEQRKMSEKYPESEFQRITSEAIERARGITPTEEGKFPPELEEYAKSIKMDLLWHSGTPDKILRSWPISLAGYLFNASPHPKNKQYSDDIAGSPYFPENFSVLEVGGFNQEDKGWFSRGGFIDSEVDYTGIDENPDKDKTEKGNKLKQTGKLDERLQMDANNVPKELKGRRYDLVFGMGFMGYPMEYRANKQGTTEVQYEKQILGNLSKVLKDGGLMFFINREPGTLKSEDVKKLGLEFVEKEIYGRQTWILRKTPKE